MAQAAGHDDAAYKWTDAASAMQSAFMQFCIEREQGVPHVADIAFVDRHSNNSVRQGYSQAGVFVCSLFVLMTSF